MGGLSCDDGHFYPRSPCGERQFCPTLEGHKIQISIHALLAESDTCWCAWDMAAWIFLSTLSLRRATASPRPSGYGRGDFYPRSPCGERPGKLPGQYGQLPISIHALLAESDPATQGIGRGADHFYPRSPCGERLTKIPVLHTLSIFLSTLSLRRAT